MAKLLSTEFLSKMELGDSELKETIEHNRRSELSKYYQKVRKCKLCSKEYGFDNHEKEHGTCPVCARRIII